MGIQINGQTDTVASTTSGGRVNLTPSINVTGVSTFTTLNVTSIVGVTTAGITSAYVNSINNGQIGGFRNVLHNGSFTISQKGTPTTGMQIDSRGACDRWFQWAGVGGQQGVSTWSQESGDSTLFALAGVANHLKVDVTTAESSLASNEAYAINQRIEGLNVQNLLWGTSKAKPVTLSFYAKADNATGTYCVSLLNSSASDRSYIQEYTVTSSWQKYIMTFPGDTSVAITNDNTGRLGVYFTMMAGSSWHSSANTWNSSSLVATSNQTNLFSSTANNFYLAAVQLEVGDRATEFENRGFGIELALCQRYYEKSYDVDVAPGTVTAVGAELNRAATTESNFNIRFKVPKRATPTVTSYSSVTGTSGKFRQYDSTGQDITPTVLNPGMTGVRIFGTISNSGGYADCHWTASAEI